MSKPFMIAEADQTCEHSFSTRISSDGHSQSSGLSDYDEAEISERDIQKLAQEPNKW